MDEKNLSPKSRCGSEIRDPGGGKYSLATEMNRRLHVTHCSMCFVLAVVVI